MPSDSFTITLHRHISGKEQVSLVDPQYLPRRHGEAWGEHRGQGQRHPGCQLLGAGPAAGSLSLLRALGPCREPGLRAAEPGRGWAWAAA